MKKILLFFATLILAISLKADPPKYYTIDIGQVSDTMIVIPIETTEFGWIFYIEAIYTALDGPCTLDISVSGAAATFNSYADLVGASLPATLDPTADLNSYTNTASKYWYSTELVVGEYLKIYIKDVSASAGDNLILKVRLWKIRR